MLHCFEISSCIKNTLMAPSSDVMFPATIASGASPWLLHPSAKQPQALLDLCVDFCTHYFYLFAASSHGMLLMWLSRPNAGKPPSAANSDAPSAAIVNCTCNRCKTRITTAKGNSDFAFSLTYAGVVAEPSCTLASPAQLHPHGMFVSKPWEPHSISFCMRAARSISASVGRDEPSTHGSRIPM